MARPLVLMSNDDGIQAEGLRALRAAIEKYARVIVCAPELNQSATSHALSIHRSLRLRELGRDTYALDGTPADCVYVALHSKNKILPRRPDIVVSGMNHGPNLGIDVFYSGTVAAAREAAFRNVPAIAVSADLQAERRAAATLAARVVRAALIRIQNERASLPVLLSLNIPKGRRWQVVSTVLGERQYDQDVVFRRDPRGKEYLWIGGVDVRHRHVAGSDTEAYDRKRASLTPLSLDNHASQHVVLSESIAQAVAR